MGPVHALPTEAMLLIFAHIHLADKAAMALTCKSLNKVATSAIYRHIDIEWSKGGSLDDRPPIHLLLRTVLEDPKRADQVLTIRFAGNKCDSYWHESEKIKFRGSESVRVQQVAQKAGFSSIAPYNETPDLEYEWPQEYSGSIAELYQALFVSQLPSLHTLKIGYDCSTGFQALSNVVQYSLCSNELNRGLTKFQHLQRIELCYDMDCRDLGKFFFDAGFYHGSHSVLPFFYMPQVQRLCVVIPDGGPKLIWPCDSPCAHTLTTLVLHRSGIEPDFLAELLRATPSLCHLTYDYCVELERRINGIAYLDNRRLSTALGNVATTLETLVIRIQFWQMCETFYGMEDFRSAVSGFTSFAGLVKLQRLEVPLIVLLGADPELMSITFPIQRLPLNLRHLSLTDDLALHSYFPWRSSSVLGLLPDYTLLNGRHTKGNLAVLEMIVRESGGDWSIKLKSELRKICNLAGIACQLTHPAQIASEYDLQQCSMALDRGIALAIRGSS